ncbi:MAG: adenylate kinase [Rhodothermales bacterium]
MPRIIVVGSSCAGKSTLAQKLSAAFGLHYIQLDALSWLPNWVERDNASFLELLAQEANTHEHWVVDGNYSRTHHITWAKADVIVWLNYSYPLVLWRALTRTVRRVSTKELLFAGNVETVRRSFLSKDSILLWVIKTFHYRRRRYIDIRAKNEYDHIQWIELRRPRQVADLMVQLTELYPMPSANHSGKIDSV